METAKTMTVVDGQLIRIGEPIPDLGSWKAIRVNDNVRDYEGLSADIGKLPHYVATSSSATCLDTGDVYKFESVSDTWYKVNAAPNNGCGCHGGSHEQGNDPLSYMQLKDKPRINGIELNGDMSLEQLGIVSQIGGLRFSVNQEEQCIQIEYE